MLLPALLTLALAGPETAPALEDKVREIFEASCTACHDDSGDPTEPEGIDLSGDPRSLIGRKSAAVDRIMVVPGKPEQSYLLDKMYGTEGIEGDIMPLGDDPLPAEQLKVIEDWIASLPEDARPPSSTAPQATGPGDGTGRTPPPKRTPKPFHGTHQIVLPTTTSLGKRTLQYRIDHRFGRIGTERGAFGLDAGVVMRMQLAYGIFDGWDVFLSRTNSRKGWELGTKYIALRQEDGWPVSFGGYVSVDWFRDFDVANPWTGNFMLMLSRLWFERWSTMLTVSYHLNTNHNPRVMVDLPDDGIDEPVLVRDDRDTFDLGFASTVWLGKKRRWGIDLEWILPIPDGRRPNAFYYRGGDADPRGSKIGAWSIGGSYAIGLHFFQVFFTNNREIHPNLAAPGGQSGNPFRTPGVDSKNPFHEFNFFLGFNLGRRFKL